MFSLTTSSKEISLLIDVLDSHVKSRRHYKTAFCQLNRLITLFTNWILFQLYYHKKILFITKRGGIVVSFNCRWWQVLQYYYSYSRAPLNAGSHSHQSVMEDINQSNPYYDKIYTSYSHVLAPFRR